MSGFEGYGFFLLKLASIIVAILLVWLGLMLISTRAKRALRKGYLSIVSLNDEFDRRRRLMERSVLPKAILKQQLKAEKKQRKQASKKHKKQKQRDSLPCKVFVLDFKGDIAASAVDNLRREVDAVLHVANGKRDRVLLRLESPGGTVPGYGLAASQLDRLRQVGIPLTVAVDKVAASGGYMMACVANEIIAAPFAIIGSIGVIFQLPNLHKWLDKKGIEFEQVKAGEYKRTLTVFGKNTPAAREKVQEEIDHTHDLFKQFVKEHRSQVNIKKVATGQYWFAKQAEEMKLVDKLQTSDDYLLTQHYHTDCELYHVSWKTQKSLKNKFSQAARMWLFGV